MNLRMTRCLALLLQCWFVAVADVGQVSEWHSIHVPGAWETNGPPVARAYDGFAWYRAWLKPHGSFFTKHERDLFAESVTVTIRDLADAHEVFVNGKRIGKAVIEVWPKLTPEIRPSALALLISRVHWCMAFLQAAQDGKFSLSGVSMEIADQLRPHPDKSIRESAGKLFPKTATAGAGEFQQRLSKVEAALLGGVGNPYADVKTFVERCAACHKLAATLVLI